MSAFRIHWFASQTRFSFENRFRILPPVIRLSAIILINERVSKRKKANAARHPYICYFQTAERASKRKKSNFARPQICHIIPQINVRFSMRKNTKYTLSYQLDAE
jgi:hypothetical protein